MIKYTQKAQKKLLSILDELFEPLDDTYIVSLKLTEERLSELIVETREQIITMFFKCEKFSRRCIKVYDKIIMESLTNKLKNQEKTIKNVLADLVSQ